MVDNRTTVPPVLRSHASAYIDQLQRAIGQLDLGPIERAIEVLMDAWREERTVLLVGNGGSASTASHMMADLNMVAARGAKRFRAIALTDNVPLITGWSNDSHFAQHLAEQLRNYCGRNDVLIAISCSGNSPNVIAAAVEARARGATVIAFTGDVGGRLKHLADVCLHAPHPHVGAQEDIHLALDHLITSALRMWIDRTTELAKRPVRAVILAAGEGTRLRPLTLDRPKPMVEVQGKPVIGHIVEWLASHSVRDVAVNLHYMPESIERYLGDGTTLGVRVNYSREEVLLGSAGAMKRLEPYLQAGPIVVVYGDVLTNLDLGALIEFHLQQVALDASIGATVGLYRVPEPTRVGIVGLDARGRVTRFVEKPEPDAVFSDLANSGILIVEPHTLALIPPETFYDIGRDLLPKALGEGTPLCGWVIPAASYVLDIGSPERLALAQATFRQPHVGGG